MTSNDPRNEDRLRGIEARLAEIERRLGIAGGPAGQAYGSPGGYGAPAYGPQYGAPRPAGGSPIESDPEIQSLLMRGKKIEAIKRARQLTGWGLKDAKDAIDELSARRGYR